MLRFTSRYRAVLPLKTAEAAGFLQRLRTLQGCFYAWRVLWFDKTSRSLTRLVHFYEKS